jgi:hypothetical protein
MGAGAPDRSIDGVVSGVDAAQHPEEVTMGTTEPERSAAGVSTIDPERSAAGVSTIDPERSAAGVSTGDPERSAVGASTTEPERSAAMDPERSVTGAAVEQQEDDWITGVPALISAPEQSETTFGDFFSCL